MRTFRLAVFDLDGTLYRGMDPIPHAVETVQQLRREGVVVRFLTNNSALTNADIAARLDGMGFGATPEECLGTAAATADYLVEERLKRVYVIGEPGLSAALRGAGCEVLPSDAEQGADAVVGGICRGFTFQMLDAALQQVRGGARLIATNTDATYPLERGRVSPGAGAIVAGLRTACGVEPIVIGKPEPRMVAQILRVTGVAPQETIIVGDRPETDLAAGAALGCPTWLVLTGVTASLPPGQAGGSDLRALLDD